MKACSIILCLLISLTCASQATKSDYFKVYDTFDEFSDVLNKSGDKTYVINFWATWCKPCIAELPFFDKLEEEYGRDEVEVILVSLDAKDRIKKSLIPFIKNNNVRSTVVLLADNRTNEWIDKVDESWSGSLPATLIYDQVSYQFLEHEFESYEELKSLYEQFIKS